MKKEVTINRYFVKTEIVIVDADNLRDAVNKAFDKLNTNPDDFDHKCHEHGLERAEFMDYEYHVRDV